MPNIYHAVVCNCGIFALVFTFWANFKSDVGTRRSPSAAATLHLQGASVWCFFFFFQSQSDGCVWQWVIPCYTMLYHVIPCYTMLYHHSCCLSPPMVSPRYHHLLCVRWLHDNGNCTRSPGRVAREASMICGCLIYLGYKQLIWKWDDIYLWFFN